MEFTRGYLRVILPGLKRINRLYGHYPISKFTPGLLFEFKLLMKSEDLSQSTQNRYVDLIIRIINFSFKQKRININPTLGYEKGREVYEEMDFWNEEEVQIFLNFANLKYPRGHKKRWIYCAYLMALETAVRARELWGFQLRDVPITEAKIKVTRQASGFGNFELTKGKDSRFVPFSEGLKSELGEVFTGRDKITRPMRTIFISKRGSPIHHDNFVKRVFLKDVLECGVKVIRFHDLRHTGITLFVLKGIPLPIIQKIAGHKDIKTTMRYVHVLGRDIDNIGAQVGLNVSASPKLLKMVQ